MITIYIESVDGRGWAKLTPEQTHIVMPLLNVIRSRKKFNSAAIEKLREAGEEVEFSNKFGGRSIDSAWIDESSIFTDRED